MTIAKLFTLQAEYFAALSAFVAALIASSQAYGHALYQLSASHVQQAWAAMPAVWAWMYSTIGGVWACNSKGMRAHLAWHHSRLQRSSCATHW